MKAILLMDMPTKCEECPLHYRKRQGIYRCEMNHKNVDIEQKPSWCPLKPIPKELVYEGYDSPNEQIGEAILRSEWGKKAKKNDAICIRSFSIGYNSCLEEITGETE